MPLVAVCLIASACSKSPVTPPTVINTPPTIDSLTIAGERVEADQTVQVTAVVKDTESPLDQLTYTWSATPSPGTFSGTGASVTWRAPKGQTTPALYTILLTITEAYTSAGQARVNTASSSATVHYNDSPAETKFLAHDFLVNKFGNFNVGPAEAVSNFTDSCSGKADEFDDVKDNRAEVHILSASFPSPVATFNASLTEGTVEGSCQFEDIPNSGPNAGKREFVSGTCFLTTKYENFRWFLCESSFLPPYNTTLASLRNRVPGRLLMR